MQLCTHTQTHFVCVCVYYFFSSFLTNIVRSSLHADIIGWQKDLNLRFCWNSPLGVIELTVHMNAHHIWSAQSQIKIFHSQELTTFWYVKQEILPHILSNNRYVWKIRRSGDRSWTKRLRFFNMTAEQIWQRCHQTGSEDISQQRCDVVRPNFVHEWTRTKGLEKVQSKFTSRRCYNPRISKTHFTSESHIKSWFFVLLIAWKALDAIWMEQICYLLNTKEVGHFYFEQKFLASSP